MSFHTPLISYFLHVRMLYGFHKGKGAHKKEWQDWFSRSKYCRMRPTTVVTVQLFRLSWVWRIHCRQLSNNLRWKMPSYSTVISLPSRVQKNVLELFRERRKRQKYTAAAILFEIDSTNTVILYRYSNTCKVVSSCLVEKQHVLKCILKFGKESVI
jgi:hypothetical protein